MEMGNTRNTAVQMANQFDRGLPRGSTDDDAVLAGWLCNVRKLFIF